MDPVDNPPLTASKASAGAGPAQSPAPARTVEAHRQFLPPTPLEPPRQTVTEGRPEELPNPSLGVAAVSDSRNPLLESTAAGPKYPEPGAVKNPPLEKDKHAGAITNPPLARPKPAKPTRASQSTQQKR